MASSMLSSEWLLMFSRALSISVIVLSTVTKLPQVWKIYSAGTSKGISVRGYWLEVAAYLVGGSYGFYYDFHYLTYVEAVILALQSSTVIILSVNYTKQFNIENITYTAVLSVFLYLVGVKMIPGIVLDSMLLTAIPLSACSKLMQINAIYTDKKGGDVSLLSWSLSTYACAARVFTTIVETPSLTFLSSYLISFILNAIIVLQILYYDSNSKKKTT